MRAWERRLGRVQAKYVEELNKIPATPVVNARYNFDLDQRVLSSLFADLDQFVDSILLEGGESRPWFFEAYVSVAYQRGTAQSFANLSAQSPAYASGQANLRTILYSEPYQTRVGILRSRVFEEMRGLSATVKQDMNRVLADGMARGKNPREIAKNLSRQTDIEGSRARRIARTEVPMALRRARWDERDDAAERYGLNTKLLHLSALSPTTRATHAQRHGKLYASEDVRDWYAVDGNAINCKCNQTEVLVDENGKAVVPSIITRAMQNYAAAEKRWPDAPWNKG